MVRVTIEQDGEIRSVFELEGDSAIVAAEIETALINLLYEDPEPPPSSLTAGSAVP